jgi:kynurenine 3-monooxygenase
MEGTYADCHVCVVGAGLAGTLTALLLAKLGMKVSIYEKRRDFRDEGKASAAIFGTSESATKRSINLALSQRGILALKEVGALETVMKKAIRMPCRVIHTPNAPDMTQAYGKPDEAIWSVGRQFINETLLDMVSAHGSGVELFFDHHFLDNTADGICTFDVGGKHIKVATPFDLIIGADGAYSGVREVTLRKSRINFSREYCTHGYKEISIPATADNDYALPNYQGLHIWPRGQFMLIAIPNSDKSFTATLFAPYSGPDGFDAVDPENKAQVLDYFSRHFPDIIPLMPDLVNDFKNNPVGALVTVKVNPWSLGKVVLLGDAAHAVVPFFGQGMNAGFQDGLLLYRKIQQRVAEKRMPIKQELVASAEEFGKERVPATDALAELCLEHLNDMASNTASRWYLLTKRLEASLSAWFPQTFVPLYTMVSFQDVPYHEAVARAHRQDVWLSRILGAQVLLLGAGLVGAGFMGYKHYLNRK